MNQLFVKQKENRFISLLHFSIIKSKFRYEINLRLSYSFECRTQIYTDASQFGVLPSQFSYKILTHSTHNYQYHISYGTPISVCR